MTALRLAAQQALEALEWHYRQGHSNTLGGFRLKIDEKALRNLRAALAQQAEPTDPGHDVDVLREHVRHLERRVRELHAQQAEPDVYGYASRLAVAVWEKHYKGAAPQWKPLDDLMGVLTQIDNMTSGLTRLAQQAEPVAVAERERIAAQWDGCVAHQLDTFGPVDIGASIRAGELVEPAQQAEPVDGACLHGVDDGACKECYAANAEPGAWVASKDGRVIYDNAFTHDAVLRVAGDFENDEQRARYAQRIVDKLNAAPPQRLPLTEEGMIAQRDALLEALKLARSIIGHPDDAHSRLIDAAVKAVEKGK
jgi:hypothetical protein